MVYFSRLTDIVTCSLSNILEGEADPAAAIVQIIKEMEEGLAGAKRSAQTAAAAEQRIRNEMAAHEEQSANWLEKARAALTADDETTARTALARKQEIENIVAGLQQQHQAACTTLEHLSTTQRALTGRLAEACRKRDAMQNKSQPAETKADPTKPLSAEHTDAIETELDALKRELENK